MTLTPDNLLKDLQPDSLATLDSLDLTTTQETRTSILKTLKDGNFAREDIAWFAQEDNQLRQEITEASPEDKIAADILAILENLSPETEAIIASEAQAIAENPQDAVSGLQRLIKIAVTLLTSAGPAMAMASPPEGLPELKEISEEALEQVIESSGIDATHHFLYSVLDNHQILTPIIVATIIASLTSKWLRKDKKWEQWSAGAAFVASGATVSFVTFLDYLSGRGGKPTSIGSIVHNMPWVKDWSSISYVPANYYPFSIPTNWILPYLDPGTFTNVIVPGLYGFLLSSALNVQGKWKKIGIGVGSGVAGTLASGAHIDSLPLVVALFGSPFIIRLLKKLNDRYDLTGEASNIKDRIQQWNEQRKRNKIPNPDYGPESGPARSHGNNSSTSQGNQNSGHHEQHKQNQSDDW